jgi:UDP-glucuronate 4-epimerase
MMAYSCTHLYHLPVTGLPFFTVYGSWGRPDMAFFLFTKAIVEGRAIKVFNHGRMRRGFTHINDACRIVLRLIDHVPLAGPAGAAPARIYNIGSQHPGGRRGGASGEAVGPYRGKGYAADAAR